jgi:hypothetical protein
MKVEVCWAQKTSNTGRNDFRAGILPGDVGEIKLTTVLFTQYVGFSEEAYLM